MRTRKFDAGIKCSMLSIYIYFLDSFLGIPSCVLMRLYGIRTHSCSVQNCVLWWRRWREDSQKNLHTNQHVRVNPFCNFHFITQKPKIVHFQSWNRFCWWAWETLLWKVRQEYGFCLLHSDRLIHVFFIFNFFFTLLQYSVCVSAFDEFRV